MHPTAEQIAKNLPAEVRYMQARFASTCPQCARKLCPGDRIGSPTQFRHVREERKTYKVQGKVWYCADCAERVAAVWGWEVAGVIFIDSRAADAFKARQQARIAAYFASIAGNPAALAAAEAAKARGAS